MGNVGVDVAVGLVFAFWVFSLVAAGVTEAISNFLSKRGNDLVRGLRALLEAPPENKPTATATTKAWTRADKAEAEALPTVLSASATTPAVAKEKVAEAGGLTAVVLAHPLLQSLQRPRRWRTGLKPPSYIPSRTFARALLDTLVPADGEKVDLDALKEAVKKLPEVAQRPLLQLISEAGDQVDDLRKGIEEWFDDQMERVSGWYRRWAKKWALGIGLVVAIVLNVDTVAMAETLYRDPAVREAVVAQADAACAAQPSDDDCGDASVEDLQATGLPFGWSCLDDDDHKDWSNCLDQGGTQVPLRVLGWLLTAGAITLGAPFWFDAMNRIGSLRNTGGKPAPVDGT